MCQNGYKISESLYQPEHVIIQHPFILGSLATAVNKISAVPVLMELTFWQRRQTLNINKIILKSAK